MDVTLLDQRVEEMKDDIIRSTQELIRFRSLEAPESGPGKPFGDEVAKSLEYTLELGRKMGFTVKDLDGYAGFMEYGEGKEMVAVLVHVDIVPEGDGWQYPPYGGEIHDGKIYGRGAVDNKGPAVAAVYALKALADVDAPLKRRVRVIVGANEESGMKCMKRYKETEELPYCGFAPDADYPIINTEKGIMTFNLRKSFQPGEEGEVTVLKLQGGTVANSVPDHCEALLKASHSGKQAVEEALSRMVNIQRFAMRMEETDEGILIHSTGVAAHGSTPEQGKNAISQMMVFLNTLPLGKNDQARFIHEYVTRIGMEYNGQSIGVGFSDELSGLLIFNVGVARMDEEKADIRVNIRYPVANTGDEVVAGIRENLEGTGISLENLSDSKPHHVPADHFLIQSLSKVYEEMTGDKTRLIAIGGGTYARTMPNSVAFGPGIPGEPDVAHKENEFIRIDNLLLNTKITARAMYELAKAD